MVYLVHRAMDGVEGAIMVLTTYFIWLKEVSPLLLFRQSIMISFRFQSIMELLLISQTSIRTLYGLKTHITFKRD